MKKRNNWNMIKSASADDIAVKPEIAVWETAYRLPVLLGTPRQVAWARSIRHPFLKHIFTNILDTTVTMNLADAKNVYVCLDELRADRESRHWIEVYRHHLSDPTTAVVKRAAARAARLAHEERHKQEVLLWKQRAAQTRKLNSESRKWEVQHGLPEITGVSTKQVNFGRRCRYQICSHAPEEVHHRSTDAGYWIAMFLEMEAEANAMQEALRDSAAN